MEKCSMAQQKQKGIPPVENFVVIVDHGIQLVKSDLPRFARNLNSKQPALIS